MKTNLIPIWTILTLSVAVAPKSSAQDPWTTKEYIGYLDMVVFLKSIDRNEGSHPDDGVCYVQNSATNKDGTAKSGVTNSNDPPAKVFRVPIPQIEDIDTDYHGGDYGNTPGGIEGKKTTQVGSGDVDYIRMDGNMLHVKVHCGAISFNRGTSYGCKILGHYHPSRPTPVTIPLPLPKEPDDPMPANPIGPAAEFIKGYWNWDGANFRWEKGHWKLPLKGFLHWQPVLIAAIPGRSDIANYYWGFWFE